VLGGCHSPSAGSGKKHINVLKARCETQPGSN
jgi:hypothetical protein